MTKKKLLNIKDSSVNEQTIAHLESMLEDAKSGEIRGIFFAVEWDNGEVTSNWVIDDRMDLVKFIGGLVLSVDDFKFRRNAVRDDTATGNMID